MTSPIADLELLLSPFMQGLGLSLRHRRPGDAGDTLRGPFPTALNPTALKALALSPAEYGSTLTAQLLADESARDGFLTACAGAVEAQQRLRIRLHLHAPGLHNLIWETLRDPLSGAFLALDQRLLLSRYVAAAHDGPVLLRPRSEARALAVVAAPRGLGALGLSDIDAAAELANAQAALAGMDPDLLPLGVSCSLANLEQRLRAGYDILYLVAHGAFADEQPWLFLEGPDGQVEQVNGADLAQLMRGLDDRRPRLVVLASCESAGDTRSESLTALGPLLAQAGVPAVVAMQGLISVETVALMLPVFFARLQLEGFADQAMADARFAARHRDDWWMPVLFTRLQDGRIWGSPPAPAEHREQRRVDAALPARVVVGEPTQVWVQICLPSERGFLDELPATLPSGEEITLQDVRDADRARFTFPVVGGAPQSARLQIVLDAPGFSPPSSVKDIELFPAESSEKQIFTLTPARATDKTRPVVTVRQLRADGSSYDVVSIPLETRIVSPAMRTLGLVGGLVRNVFSRLVSARPSEPAAGGDSPEILGTPKGLPPLPAGEEPAMPEPWDWEEARWLPPPTEVRRSSPILRGYVPEFGGPLLRSEAPGSSPELPASGIDATTGQALLRIDAAAAARLAQARPFPRELWELLSARRRADEQGHLTEDGHRVGPGWLDPAVIADARWAVVVSAAADSALLAALWPLIAHRMGQMGLAPGAPDFRPGESCGEWQARASQGGQLDLGKGWGQMPPVLVHRPGETMLRWLARHGVGPGPADPRRGVPYHLLLAAELGAPEAAEAEIPLALQEQLAVFHSVGRLCFRDRAGAPDYAAYAAYAQRLVELEQARAEDSPRGRWLYIAPGLADDEASRRAAELAQALADADLGGERQGLIGAAATRRAIAEQLGGAQGPPELLFFAGHGLGLAPGDSAQGVLQGGLVTQGWGGQGRVRPEHRLAGNSLEQIGDLAGAVAVLYASYSAATPALDKALSGADGQPPRIAPQPLIGGLAEALLRHGARGVFGFADRMWLPGGAPGEPPALTAVTQSLLGQLARGRPLGHAANGLAGQWAATGHRLRDELEALDFGRELDAAALARLWAEYHNLRALILLGDPAAQLPRRAT